MFLKSLPIYTRRASDLHLHLGRVISPAVVSFAVRVFLRLLTIVFNGSAGLFIKGPQPAAVCLSRQRVGSPWASVFDRREVLCEGLRGWAARIYFGTPPACRDMCDLVSEVIAVGATVVW